MKAAKRVVIGGVYLAIAAWVSAASGDPVPVVPEAIEPLGNFTYFTIRPDTRRCASPQCGGFFVKRVNRRTTRCADGTLRSECYVAEIDSGALALSAEQDEELHRRSSEFLLRGTIRPKQFVPAVKLGTFRAREAWRGHEGVMPTGTFFHARSTGIVCITFPCLSFTGEKLNSFDPSEVFADVNLSGIPSDLSAGHAQLREPEGLMVAAVRKMVSGPAGEAKTLDASEYYLPFDRKKQACGSRGLPACPKGQFCNFPPSANCGRADAAGICALRPEVCTDEFDPVCGCDGKTYGNACEAAAAGVSVDFRGECQAQVCGTIRGLTCEPKEFCDLGIGQCKVADAAGVCNPQTDVCLQIYAPVCGCDGKTYSNACVAHANGAQIDHAGRCR